LKPDNSNAEFGFYYIHYNDKIPFLGFVNDSTITANPFGLGYKLQYGKNRDLFGASVNGNIGDWAVGAEVSYRPRDGVGIDPTVPLEGQYCAFCAPGTYDGYIDEKKWQAHLTAIYLLGPSGDLGWILRGTGAAEGTLLFEAAVAYYPSLDRSGKYPILLPNYEMPDKVSTGMVTSFNLVYPHVFGTSVNMTPQIDLLYDITAARTIPFVEVGSPHPVAQFRVPEQVARPAAVHELRGRRGQQPAARPRLHRRQRLVLLLTMATGRRSPPRLRRRPAGDAPGGAR
jgi:hypothetical protein